MIYCTVISNCGSFAYYYSHSMIYKQPSSYFCSWVNFYSCEKPTEPVNLALLERIVYVCIESVILCEILVCESRGYKIITSSIFLEAGSFFCIFLASSYNSLKKFIYMSSRRTRLHLSFYFCSEWLCLTPLTEPQCCQLKKIKSLLCLT